MERIPEEHKRTIRRLVSRNKAVARASCAIPHVPRDWLKKGSEEDLPYCGCFLGTYAWMQECSRGSEISIWQDVPETVAMHTGISVDALRNFGYWCTTYLTDELAVEYTSELLNA